MSSKRENIYHASKDSSFYDCELFSQAARRWIDNNILEYCIVEIFTHYLFLKSSLRPTQIGAQKAGTTALFTLLNMEPQAMGSVEIETHFFNHYIFKSVRSSGFLF